MQFFLLEMECDQWMGRFYFPQALANGRDETLLCTNETAGKEIVSVKNNATQNFVFHFTFSSYRNTFSCSSSKHIERSEFYFKVSKNKTKKIQLLDKSLLSYQ
jgi:hypothetical protein